MGANELVSNIIGSVLSWPVIVAVALAIFHSPLRDLLGRIKSIEWGNTTVVLEAADVAAEAMESVNDRLEAAAPDKRRPLVRALPEFRRLNPIEMPEVDELSTEVETELAALAVAQGIEIEPTYTGSGIARLLAREGVLPERVYEAVRRAGFLRRALKIGKERGDQQQNLEVRTAAYRVVAKAVVQAVSSLRRVRLPPADSGREPGTV